MNAKVIRQQLLAILLATVVTPTANLSADDAVPPSPQTASNTSEAPRTSPALKGKVTQTSFLHGSRLRDLKRNPTPNPNAQCEPPPPPIPYPTKQAVPGYCRRKSQCVHWWFSYIKGNGPAVWDRDD